MYSGVIPKHGYVLYGVMPKPGYVLCGVIPKHGYVLCGVMPKPGNVLCGVIPKQYIPSTLWSFTLNMNSVGLHPSIFLGMYSVGTYPLP